MTLPKSKKVSRAKNYPCSTRKHEKFVTDKILKTGRPKPSYYHNKLEQFRVVHNLLFEEIKITTEGIQQDIPSAVTITEEDSDFRPPVSLTLLVPEYKRSASDTCVQDVMESLSDVDEQEIKRSASEGATKLETQTAFDKKAIKQIKFPSFVYNFSQIIDVLPMVPLDLVSLIIQYLGCLPFDFVLTINRCFLKYSELGEGAVSYLGMPEYSVVQNQVGHLYIYPKQTENCFVPIESNTRFISELNFQQCEENINFNIYKYCKNLYLNKKAALINEGKSESDAKMEAQRMADNEWSRYTEIRLADYHISQKSEILEARRNDVLSAVEMHFNWEGIDCRFPTLKRFLSVIIKEGFADTLIFDGSTTFGKEYSAHEILEHLKQCDLARAPIDNPKGFTVLMKTKEEKRSILESAVKMRLFSQHFLDRIMTRINTTSDRAGPSMPVIGNITACYIQITVAIAIGRIMQKNASKTVKVPGMQNHHIMFKIVSRISEFLGYEISQSVIDFKFLMKSSLFKIHTRETRISQQDLEARMKPIRAYSGSLGFFKNFQYIANEKIIKKIEHILRVKKVIAEEDIDRVLEELSREKINVGTGDFSKALQALKPKRMTR